MLVSYKWLEQYIDLDGIDAHELAEKLTRAGIEVEQVIDRSAGLDHVVVGHVQACEQHPNADKLRVCQVDVGDPDPLQIICGAPNVGQGQRVVVAKIGAVLPGNVKIKKAKLRGELSQGMICSGDELGIDSALIADDHKGGILVLENNAQVGDNAAAYVGLDDCILELELTPNRSDCLSMIGVAYEVGAILNRPIHTPTLTVQEDQFIPGNCRAKVDIQSSRCKHYVAREVQHITIAPSPTWLQNRLIAAGVRPINNIVDVTNYVMLEYGQPLHAFDAAKVHNRHIIVRDARQGESVQTLDGQDRELNEGMLVITDPQKIIAVAGVMGAANSEVTEETTDILLESAYFDGPSVRTSARELGIRSEASIRFEKGVDPDKVTEAVDRAAALLTELAGGKVVEETAEQDNQQNESRRISLHMAHLNDVLGTSFSTAEVTALFDRLAFMYENKGHEIVVDIPNRRQDLAIEEDLIEEVARLHGYDAIPTTLPTGRTTPGSRTPVQRLRRVLKKTLQAAGLDQLLTYSLGSEQGLAWKEFFYPEAQPIRLSMPMSEERSHLRTSLIPNLLEVVSYNQNRNQRDVHGFEIGTVFVTEQSTIDTLPSEKEMVAGVFSGLWENHPWQQQQTKVDFYVVKGVVERLLEKLEITGVTYESAAVYGLHPGRCARIFDSSGEIGYIGQIHPQLQKQLDIEPTYVFELSMDALNQRMPAEISYRPLPKYPSTERDLAIVVDKSVHAGTCQSIIEQSGSKLLSRVHLFDVYEGERIEEGKKSLAFSLTYQHQDKTLTDEEVQKVHDRIVQQLQKRIDAELRK